METPEIDPSIDADRLSIRYTVTWKVLQRRWVARAEGVIIYEGESTDPTDRGALEALTNLLFRATDV